MTEGDNIKIWCEGIQKPFTFKGNAESINDVIQFFDDPYAESSLDVETKEKKFMFQKSKTVCIEIIKEV